ncbi:ATP-binding protein [Deltaproteobacteria bacterium IMCC39524]|nr:ATP-binding protein [Deltaproteobacteria bacterium IMCC39524]
MINNQEKSSISLAGRLTLALTAVVAVVTFLADVWFYFDATHKEETRIEAKARQISTYLQGALSLPLWEIDDQAVKMIGQTLMEDQTLSAVNIQDSDGNPIYTQHKDNGTIALTHLVSIEHQDSVVGTVQVNFSAEAARLQTEKLLWANVIILLAVLLAISLSTVYLINRLLRRPIEQLTAVAKSFAQGPHVDFDTMPRSYREFHPLLTVLTEMEDQIKRQISELTESSERFRQVAMTNWVWETDVEGVYKYCSDNVVDTLGYTSEEMLGKTPFDFMVEDEAVRIRGLFAETVANKKQIVDLENWNISKGGAKVCLLTNGAPFFDEEGKLIGYRGADKDITDRKLAEIELTKYREQLELLVEERTTKLKEAQEELIQKERLATLGRLTATVSHELRNPLGTIQTALFSIEDSLQRKDYSQGTRSLELAERSIGRCVAIIEELNSYARVKELKIAEASIDDWLRAVLKEQSIPEEISCELDLSIGIRPSFDQEKLRQVAVNLITNAVHALQDKTSGKKLLRISTHLLDDNYEIRFSDNGIGMSEDIKEKVFEPLYSTKGFGVGLGMVVVKNIVEQHHGEIYIESKEGKGTTVTLRLPLHFSRA